MMDNFDKTIIDNCQKIQELSMDILGYLDLHETDIVPKQIRNGYMNEFEDVILLAKSLESVIRGQRSKEQES